MIVQKAIAFFRRDLQIESSYKLAFVFEAMTTLFPLLTLYFIAKLMSPTAADPRLAPYGGAYFPFAVIGLAFTQYFMTALTNFAGTIRRSQMAGCLEAMLSTRTPPGTVILLSSVYSFVAKLFHLVMVLAASWLLLGVDFSRCNWLSAGVTLVLTVMGFSGLGILSAAFIIVMKKGDPVEWLVGALGSLLGGALFPVAVMPQWLQSISALLPTTYALEAMRLAMLKGHSLWMLRVDLAVLLATAIVLLPVSVWMFSKAVERGRRDGTLMHY